jgi:hypothetical protein
VFGGPRRVVAAGQILGRSVSKLSLPPGTIDVQVDGDTTAPADEVVLGREGALAAQRSQGDLLKDVVDVSALETARTEYCRNPGLRGGPGSSDVGGGQQTGHLFDP